MTARLAVLASHGGSVLQAVIDAVEAGDLHMEIVLVISNNSGSTALRRAAECGIKGQHLSGHTHRDPALLDGAMVAALQNSRANWILLAGYMKKLGPQTLTAFRNQIVNTHPALLPRYGGRGFYGRKVHAAVLAAGDGETGATVHLVEDEYDSGPVLSQVRVPVRADDTVADLEERVKTAERKLIVATLAELANRRQVAGY